MNVGNQRHFLYCPVSWTVCRVPRAIKDASVRSSSQNLSLTPSLIMERRHSISEFDDELSCSVEEIIRNCPRSVHLLVIELTNGKPFSHRLRILVIGKVCRFIIVSTEPNSYLNQSGAGKSSLINATFDVDDAVRPPDKFCTLTSYLSSMSPIPRQESRIYIKKSPRRRTHDSCFMIRRVLLQGTPATLKLSNTLSVQKLWQRTQGADCTLFGRFRHKFSSSSNIV